jgi:hypothetical protein
MRAYGRHNVTMARHIPDATFATRAANWMASHDLADIAHADASRHDGMPKKRATLARRLGPGAATTARLPSRHPPTGPGMASSSLCSDRGRALAVTPAGSPTQMI